jgi:hypothetical protein
MTTSGWSRHLQQIVLGGLLGCAAIALVAPSGARAAEDEDAPSIWNLDKRIYRNVLYGLGFRDSSEQAIEYRERSPLVVPPSRSLPAPQANASARSNPAWPKDPDVTRRETKRKNPTWTPGDNRDAIEKFGTIISPSELNKGVPTPRQSTQKTGTVDDSYAPVAPSELGYFGGAWSYLTSGFGLMEPTQEVGTFKNEPPRTSLIAPPPGYQTPSPAQPYGFTKRPEYQKPIKTEDLVVGKPGQ